MEKKVRIGIIGCGGISTAEDAYKMMRAGASLVQIGTEFIYNGGKTIRTLNKALGEEIKESQTQKK